MEDSRGFDFSTLFYIIATLVAVLVGLLGKKKKPVVSAPTPEPESEKKGNFFDILGKELEGYLETRQSNDLKPVAGDTLMEEPVQNGYAEEEEPVGTVSSSRGYERMMIRETEDYLDLPETEGTGSANPLQVIELEEPYGGRDYFEIIRDFDAATAVIYSAIINKIDF